MNFYPTLLGVKNSHTYMIWNFVEKKAQEQIRLIFTIKERGICHDSKSQSIGVVIMPNVGVRNEKEYPLEFSDEDMKKDNGDKIG